MIEMIDAPLPLFHFIKDSYIFELKTTVSVKNLKDKATIRTIPYKPNNVLSGSIN